MTEDARMAIARTGPQRARSWPAVLLAGLVAAGCGARVSTNPAAPSAHESSAPGASSVRAPSSSPSATGRAAAVAELDQLFASMAKAVSAGDRAGYLALVDLSDPVFALEHQR